MIGELLQHPLSAAFPAMNGKSWVAYLDAQRLHIRIYPSAKHPGYYHYSVLSLRDGFEDLSIRPVDPAALPMLLGSGLETRGIAVALSDWRETDDPASDPDFSPKQKRSDSVVYFVRGGPFLKIGKAVGNPASRINELQTGCPFRLELLAWIEGTISDEHELHKRFSDLRVQGEWFRYEGALIEFVKGLK